MEDLLYLFSSNIRPVYEQDVLNAMAGAAGQRYWFRYREQYVSEAAAKAWPRLVGRKALLHFSLQQPKQYHEAVFFPFRLARVTATSVEGALYGVEFELRQAVSLMEPTSDKAAS